MGAAEVAEYLVRTSRYTQASPTPLPPSHSPPRLSLPQVRVEQLDILEKNCRGFSALTYAGAWGVHRPLPWPLSSSYAGPHLSPCLGPNLGPYLAPM